MTASEAWLLDCGESFSIAVSSREMAEFVDEQNCFSVPGSPEYCSSVLVWQDKIVPVMDIFSLHHRTEEQFGTFACLLNYQEEPNTELQQLALRVSKAPEKIQVDDSQVCDVPEDLQTGVLGPIILACFTHEKKPVVVVDIARLCSAEFRDLANAA